MIIDPYRRRPEPPQVAVLLRDETHGFRVVGEQGDLYDPETLPPEVRVWGFYDAVHELVGQGYGEALCWNNEEIRWRHERLDADGWRNRPSDVAVIKLPEPDDHRETLDALAMWRDWLAGYGAAPNGTTGSAAWSLLRATLDKRLWTTVGHVPPLRATLGGRQELGPAGKGSYVGELDHFDLPAAYANEIGHLPYGGFWQDSTQLPVRRSPEWWAGEGRPVFVRAVVNVPRSIEYGPLPRRPRKRLTGIGAALFRAEFPSGGPLQGVWTWQEVAEAQAHGCKVKVLETWVHLAASQPFLPWWEALQQGRALPGLAGLLAKTTGNALWGRFCMDSRHGRRTIRGQRRGKLQQRPVRARGGLPAAHDLAETVSGRVRARLYRLIMDAGEQLVSAHTDGAWLRHGVQLPDGWRRKEQARQLDLLDPQVLRYWPKPGHAGEPFHVFAGVPAEQAAQQFAAQWHAAGFATTTAVPA